MSLSEALPTTALILCRSEHTQALQATVSEGLVQGPYIRGVWESNPRAFGRKTPNSTTEPPSHTTTADSDL